MAEYKVRDPSGRVRVISGPEGASDAEVIAQAKRLFGSVPDVKSQIENDAISQGAREFNKDSSFASNLMAGAGKALSDVGLGARQILGMDVQDEVDDRAKRDKALMSSGGGMTGNIATQVGMALLPGGVLKGAGTVLSKVPAAAKAAEIANIAGKMALSPAPSLAGVATGAGMGAVQSALQPVESGGSRLTNAATGAVAGAAVPAAMMALRGAGAAVEPLTRSGRDTIVGRTLNEAAGPDRAAVVQALTSAREIVPGSMPTAAEASGNAGVAAMQRTAAALNPSAYAERALDQNAARVAALRKISGEADDMAAAVAARESTTRPLREAALREANYGTEKTADLVGRIAQKDESIVSALRDKGRFGTFAAQQEALANSATPVAGLPRVSARVTENAQRIPEGIAAAAETAAIEGQRKAERSFLERQLTSLQQSGYSPLSAGNLTSKIEGELSKPGTRASDVVRSTLGEVRDKIASLADKAGNIDARDLYTVRKEIGNTISKHAKDSANWDKRLASGLERDIQKQIDEAISAAGGGDLWSKYLSTYQAASKPINRMQVGEELLRLGSPLPDARGNPTIYPAQFGRQTRDLDTLVQKATGFDGARAASILKPEDVASIQGIRQDLARALVAQNAGRGAGSDTVQKLAMTNIMQRSGLPTFLADLPGVSRAGKWVYSTTDDMMKQRLADALLDPKVTASLMDKATPNASRRAIVEALTAAAQAGALGSSAALNAPQ